MDKILVILTGGTIGSKSENGTVNVDSSAAYSIINLYLEKYGADTEFEAIQPINTLSENITTDTWLQLFEALDNVDYSKYNGIIICHGSDTLSYTSSAVAMLYNNVGIPIVLVAANFELSNEKSNGIRNFRSGVSLIKSGVKGVFVAYENNRGENDIYIATRIMESDPYIDQYRSFEGMPWGEIVNDKLVVKGDISVEELNQHKAIIKGRPSSFENKVLLIRPYPDMNYDSFNINGYSAIVHYMYHSATACTEGEKTSLINFAKKCRKNNVKLYIASFKNKDIDRAYKSSRKILETGVIPLFNISVEAAYVKVLLAENMEDVLVAENVFFESV